MDCSEAQNNRSKNHGFSVSPGILFSVFCLLLYTAGYIRIELKLNNHDEQLEAFEKATAMLKHRMAKASMKGTLDKCGMVIS